MTLREIVRRLDPARIARSMTERRVRHWTSSGVLRLSGTLFPGQGQAREYDEEAVFVAAVLNELAKYGMPLATLEAVARDLYGIIGDHTQVNSAGDVVGDLWQQSKAGGAIGLTMAQVPTTTAGKTQIALSIDRMDGTTNPFFPTSDGGHSAVLIDLRSLFSAIGQ